MHGSCSGHAPLRRTIGKGGGAFDGLRGGERWRGAAWRLSGEQRTQDGAQSENIVRRRGYGAGFALRTGIAWGPRIEAGVVGFAKQTRDAKIHNLGIACLGYEDVGRLEIGVDDEILMGMLHSLADRDHHLHDLARRQIAYVDVVVDGDAAHQFHDQVGRTALVDASIVELCNVAVAERCKRAAFAVEQGAGGLGEKRGANALDGDGVFKQAIVAGADEDVSHATLPDALDDAIATDAAGHGFVARLQAAGGHGAFGHGVRFQETTHLFKQWEIAGAGSREIGIAVCVSRLKRFLEDGECAAGQCGVHRISAGRVRPRARRGRRATDASPCAQRRRRFLRLLLA